VTGEHAIMIAAAAVVTYASRVAGLSLGGWEAPAEVRRIFDRVPVAVFAALAAPGSPDPTSTSLREWPGRWSRSSPFSSPANIGSVCSPGWWGMVSPAGSFEKTVGPYFANSSTDVLTLRI
jgi:hypothetical protein